jgi:putative ABC transport system ATP-binding protein
MATATPGLDVEGVTVEFPRGGQLVRALEDVSFTVDAGSMLLVLGPSGCGKRRSCPASPGSVDRRVERSRHGDVAVETLDVAHPDAYRRRVGIIFRVQSHRQPHRHRKRRHPLRSAGTSGTPGPPASRGAARIGRTRATASIEDRASCQEVNNKRRCRSRPRPDPPLVIADEPTAHLDQHNVEATLRLLRRLTDEGRVVIVSTHDTRLIPLAEQTIDLAPNTQPTGAPPGLIELEDGDDLFHEGDPSDWIYFVVTGAVDILQRDIAVATAGVGEWFGEMGPLFSLSRSATARARGFTVVEPVSTGEFRARLGVSTLRDLLGRREGIH